MEKKINTSVGFVGKLPANSLPLTASSGFTLVEMIVAFGIFAVIMVISAGSLISLIDANHKTQTVKTVVNNLHFALENMSRNIRTGRTYHCGEVGSLDSARDCANTPASFFGFIGRDGSRIVYRLNAATNALERAVKTRHADGTYDAIVPSDYVPITAPEITLEQLYFYVDGSCAFASADPACPGDSRQPRVLIVAKGSMIGKGKTVSEFSVETMVSGRQLDI